MGCEQGHVPWNGAHHEAAVAWGYFDRSLKSFPKKCPQVELMADFRVRYPETRDFAQIDEEKPVIRCAPERVDSGLETALKLFQ